jgi:hypothetical protein
MVRSRNGLLVPLLFLMAFAVCQGPVDSKPGDRGNVRATIKPDENGFISWEDAKRLILSGGTTSVAQTHERVVYVNLKDGTSYKTRETRLDEVVNLIRENGLQDKISIATE